MLETFVNDTDSDNLEEVYKKLGFSFGIGNMFSLSGFYCIMVKTDKFSNTKELGMRIDEELKNAKEHCTVFVCDVTNSEKTFSKDLVDRIGVEDIARW